MGFFRIAYFKQGAQVARIGSHAVMFKDLLSSKRMINRLCDKNVSMCGHAAEIDLLSILPYIE